MVLNEVVALVGRADASIPNFTDPWPVKDVSSPLPNSECEN
jgi:hypothetical protein